MNNDTVFLFGAGAEIAFGLPAGPSFFQSTMFKKDESLEELKELYGEIAKDDPFYSPYLSIDILTSNSSILKEIVSETIKSQLENEDFQDNDASFFNTEADSEGNSYYKLKNDKDYGDLLKHLSVSKNEEENSPQKNFFEIIKKTYDIMVVLNDTFLPLSIQKSMGKKTFGKWLDFYGKRISVLQKNYLK